MNTALIFLAALIAVCIAWFAQQTMLVMVPDLSGIARNCVGAAVFAMTLLACLVALEIRTGRG